MTNKFVIKNNISIDSPEIEQTSIDFETTDELLSHEFFVGHANKPHHTGFAKFGNTILWISDFHWWVIGAVMDADSVDLPEWDGGKYRVRLLGDDEIISGKEIQHAYSGHEVVLKDGRVGVITQGMFFPCPFWQYKDL